MVLFMKLKIFMIVLYITVFVVHTEEEMRGVFVFTPYSSNNDLENSDAALRLYKKMGYNALFENIPTRFSGWDKSDPTNWHLINDTIDGSPLSRAQFIDYIRDRKSKVNSFGLEYCPFYNPLSYGIEIWDLKYDQGIDERACAGIYREVEVAQLSNMFGIDIYNFVKASAQFELWGPNNGSVNWSKSRNSAVFTINKNVSGWMGTKIIASVGLTTPVDIIDKMPYKFKTTITLPNNLNAGDQIYLSVFREFKSIKTIPSNIPLSKYYTGKNFLLNRIKYEITERNGGTYTIRKISTSEAHSVSINNGSFPAHIITWLDNKTYWGPGYDLDSNIIWDMSFLNSKDTSGNAVVTFSDFEISMQNPIDHLVYGDWESDPDYKDYLLYYDIEKYMTTRATYTIPPYDTTFYYNNPHPTTRYPLLIKGHFKPLDNGVQHQRPLDPFSPVRDLIIRDVLSIIDTALGGEPKYFCLLGDEMFHFRRNAVSNRDLKNTPYNDMSNIEYYASILLRDIRRYKEIFGDSSGNVSTKFLLYGDMILPYAKGYHYIAEESSDNGAFKCFIDSLGTDSLPIPILWIYDYMRPPGVDGAFLLKDSAKIQESLNMIKSNNFKFMLKYATDGKINTGDMRLDHIDQSINSHEKHIDHEIQMAKNWCKFVQSPANNSHFAGYTYTGWMNNLRANGWDGLYPLAYFGWWRQNKTDLPGSWKKLCKEKGNPKLDHNGQAYLDLLDKNIWSLHNLKLRD